MERKFKVALFTVLREYYALYKQSGLPALESDFSKTVGNLYRHDHRPARELLEHCFVEDSGAKRLSERTC